MYFRIFLDRLKKFFLHLFFRYGTYRHSICVFCFYKKERARTFEIFFFAYAIAEA